MKVLVYVSLLIIAIGIVWVLQGAGYLGGSFMTGETRWLYIGIATAIAGAVLLAFASTRRRG